MKPFILFVFLLLQGSKIVFSQEVKKPVRYKYTFDPAADARKDVEEAISKAKASHRRVLVVVGGDWSIWSCMAHDSLANDETCYKNYVMVPVNFSPVNRNAEELTALGCPKNVGYPVFIVLDENGKKIHEQDTDPLKKDSRHYNMKLINGFLVSWARY